MANINAHRVHVLTLTRHGFTLLEILIVFVMMGIMLSAISLNLTPSPQQQALDDAHAIEQWLTLLSTQAETSSITLSITLTTPQQLTAWQYHTQQTNWQPLHNTLPLHQPIKLITPGIPSPIRITLFPDGTMTPFKVQLSEALNLTINSIGITTLE